MDPQELQTEKLKLADVVVKVKKAKEVVEKTLNVVGEENLDKLREYRETETGTDFEVLLYQLSEKSEINIRGKFNRYKELDYLCDEPYFARIDIQDKEDVKNNKEIYIGKFGYSEKHPVITDWRAKIASVYYRYRYPQKNVFYDTPEGRITKDLTLKRTFEIEKGELFKYYNNDLMLDESEVIAEKIAKRTGGVLEDIVSTIQLSQLDIIEADPRQICIVQGCVGSGKSTVAIHKLAHIFFNHGNIIHPHRSILVAKNQILSGYLSTLFPKLGIFDINYKTLRDLIYTVAFREGSGLKMNLDLDQDTGDFKMPEINKLIKTVQKIHAKVEKRVNEIFNKSEYITFKGFKYSNTLTPYENISDIVSDLEEELVSEKEYIKINPNTDRMVLYKSNISSLRKLINSLRNLQNDILNKYLREIYKVYGIDTKQQIGYKNTLVFLFLLSEVVGFRKFQKYEYCVVDEAQDFSLLEYLILGKLVLRGRFALFGDLNQSLETDGIKNWHEVEKVIVEAKKANVFELNTNYRSTQEIIDYSKNILNRYTKKYLPKSIKRRGEKPLTIVVDGTEKLYSELDNYLDKDLKEFKKSVGIICFSDVNKDDIYDFVKSKKAKRAIFNLSENNKIEYTPDGVYVMNSMDCKGLEFAKVYVVGLNIHKLQNFMEAKKAFVASTRAMNDLITISVK